MKTQELEHDEVRTKVREQYGKVAGNDAGCGCAPTCCGTTLIGGWFPGRKVEEFVGSATIEAGKPASY